MPTTSAATPRSPSSSWRVGERRLPCAEEKPTRPMTARTERMNFILKTDKLFGLFDGQAKKEDCVCLRYRRRIVWKKGRKRELHEVFMNIEKAAILSERGGVRDLFDKETNIYSMKNQSLGSLGKFTGV
jgi:hypothetical protein